MTLSGDVMNYIWNIQLILAIRDFVHQVPVVPVIPVVPVVPLVPVVAVLPLQPNIPVCFPLLLYRSRSRRRRGYEFV